MATVAELNVLIGADTTGLQTGLRQADQGVSQISRSLQSALQGLGGAFEGMGGIISRFGPLATGAIVGVAAAVGTLAKHAFDAAIAFDDASDRIRISTGAVGADLAKLEVSFKTIFTSIPVSAADASEAIAFLSSRLGVSGQALEDLAKTELELARITGSALKPQLEATTRVFKDWEIATASQTESLDFLFKVGQKTAVGVTELSQKLVQFGAPLRQLGFSFEEAAILIGKFQAEGVELNKALPGLRIALTKMAKEGVTDAGTAFQLLTEKIQSAKTPMKAITESVEVFGAKAGPDMAEAIKQGRFSIEELQQTIAGSRDTIIGAGQDTNDFAEKWIILKNKASEALEPLGKLVFDALGLVTGAFSDTEAEISRGWDQFWSDLAGQAAIGIDGLADKILNADKSPFFQAGASLGNAVRDGFEKGFKSLLGIEGPRIISPDAGMWKEAARNLRESGLPQSIQEIAKANLTLTQTMKDGDKASRGLTDAHNRLGESHRSGAGHAKKLSEEMQQLQKWTKEMDGSVRDLNKLFDDGGKGVHEYLMNLRPLPIRDFAAAVQTATAGVAAQGDALAKTAAFGRDWMRFVEDANFKIKTHADTVEVMKREYEKLSDSLPRAWNTIIDGFTKGISTTSIKVKGFASDLINVFDSMPGKWGQSLNRALDEVNRWISFIDSAIKLVQRMLGDESPGGLAGIIGNVFKKTADTVQASTEQINTSLGGASFDAAKGLDQLGEKLQKSGDEAAQTAGKWVAAVAGVASGIAMFAGTRHQGMATGILGGAMGGFTAGAAIGSIIPGLGTLIGGGIGALIGGIAGIFGTGRSEAQKKAERDAMENARMSMQQTAQNIINSAIEGFDKALQFFEHLDEFTAPRKAKFQAFWKSMTKLMNGFVELSKTWSATSFAQVKAIAEAIGPIAEAISVLPAAFAAINGHFGVAQSSIDRFFADFSRIMDAFFERSEVWIDGISKRAFKVANRLSPVVQLISAFGTAMTDITGVKEPSDEMFAIFDRVIDKIITHVANLTLKFDKAVLKTMANFAEKAGAALGIWRDAIESIRATVDVPTPSEASVDNVVAGIEMFVNKLSGAVERLITTDLARVSAFANTIAPIAAAIKAWAETAEVVRSYTQIAAEVWESINSDWQRGLVFMNLWILDAEIWKDKALTLKAIIAEGAAAIASAASTYVGAMTGTASALSGGLPQGGSPMGPSSLASRQSAGNTTVIHVGGMTFNSNDPDPRVKAAVKAFEDLFGSNTLNNTSSQFS